MSYNVIRFIGGQIGRFALLMGAVAVVTFALVSLSPVDPVQANVGQAALLGMSEEKRAALAAYWGSDAPVTERFLAWAGALLQGDMGTSLRYNAPVAEVIASRATNSLALMGVAWVVSGALGFALGVAAALNEGRPVDRAVRAYCFVLAASPTFWVGLLLLMVFSVWLGWFPLGFSVPAGMAASEVTFADALHHMALPAITLQCAQVAEIFGGSVLVEEVFSYPGLGQAAVTAGLGGDVALLAGIALVSAALVFAGNLAANLVYGLVDPRMRPVRADVRGSEKGEGHDR